MIKYNIIDDETDQIWGPFSFEELTALKEKGLINDDTLAAEEETDFWIPYNQLAVRVTSPQAPAQAVAHHHGGKLKLKTDKGVSSSADNDLPPVSMDEILKENTERVGGHVVRDGHVEDHTITHYPNRKKSDFLAVLAIASVFYTGAAFMLKFLGLSWLFAIIGAVSFWLLTVGGVAMIIFFLTS